MASLFRPIQRTDLEEIRRDIDSYVIVSRSLNAFKPEQVTPFFLASNKCVPCKNFKMAHYLTQREDLQFPADINHKHFKEFTLCGFGANQIFILISFCTVNNDIRTFATTENPHVDDSDEEQVEPTNDTTTTTTSALWTNFGKKFILSRIINPALECLNAKNCISFLHGSSVKDVESDRNTSTIKIFEEDFLEFSQAVDNNIDKLVEEGVLSFRTQILFYKSCHGILGEPANVVTMIKDQINPDFNSNIVCIQLHMGFNMKMKNNDNQITVYDYENLNSLIGSRGRNKLTKYRSYFSFYKGYFGTFGSFRRSRDMYHPGSVTYIQGYDPGSHIIRQFKKSMNFSTYLLLGKLHTGNHEALKKQRVMVNNMISAIEDYFRYLKSGNIIRFEFVLSLDSSEDISLDRLPDQHNEIRNNMCFVSEKFLIPLIEAILTRNVICVSTGRWFAEHLAQNGEFFINRIKNILSGTLDAPVDNITLFTVHYLEILLKYFLFGTTNRIPFQSFKFCLSRSTELSSLDDNGIVCFNPLERVTEDLDSFVAVAKPAIGTRDYYVIPQMKVYISIILNLIHQTNTEEFFLTDEDRNFYNTFRDDENQFSQLLQKIKLLMLIFGHYARTLCGVQDNVHPKTNVRNIFKKSSLLKVAKRSHAKNKQKFSIDGLVEARVVYRAIKNPKALFGQVALGAVTTPEDISNPTFSNLLFYFIKTYVEVFPVTLLYGNARYIPHVKAQYHWINVNYTRRCVSVATQTTDEEARGTNISMLDPSSKKTVFTLAEVNEIINLAATMVNNRKVSDGPQSYRINEDNVEETVIVCEPDFPSYVNNDVYPASETINCAPILEKVEENIVLPLVPIIKKKQLILQETTTQEPPLPVLSIKPLEVKRTLPVSSSSLVGRQKKSMKMSETPDDFLHAPSTSKINVLDNVLLTDGSLSVTGEDRLRTDSTTVVTDDRSWRSDIMKSSKKKEYSKRKSFLYSDEHLAAIANHGWCCIKSLRKVKGINVWTELAKNHVLFAQKNGPTDMAIMKKFRRMVETEEIKSFLNKEQRKDVYEYWTSTADK